MVEKALEANRIRRKVRLRVPGCFGISSMITGADCLAIVPEQLGKTDRQRRTHQADARSLARCLPITWCNIGTSATRTTRLVNGCAD